MPGRSLSGAIFAHVLVRDDCQGKHVSPFAAIVVRPYIHGEIGCDGGVCVTDADGDSGAWLSGSPMMIMLYRWKEVCVGAERLREVGAVFVAGKRERNDEVWVGGERVVDKRNAQRGCC